MSALSHSFYLSLFFLFNFLYKLNFSRLVLLGMLSPASRGSLVSVAVALFVLMGVFAGYFSARVYRTIKGQHWTRAAALTSTLFPGTVFTVVFIVNFFVWGAQSSGAIPITTLIALLFMWFGASGPLTFCGYYFGFRKGPFDTPCRTNQIPRQVLLNTL